MTYREGANVSFKFSLSRSLQGDCFRNSHPRLPYGKTLSLALRDINLNPNPAISTVGAASCLHSCCQKLKREDSDTPYGQDGALFHSMLSRLYT